MCCCDSDAAVRFRKRLRTARKQWECCECKEVIEPGTVYHEHSGLWLSYNEHSATPRWDTFRMCVRCEQDWRVLSAIQAQKWNGDTCGCYTGLRDAVLEACCGHEIIGPDHCLMLQWHPETAEELVLEEITRLKECIEIFDPRPSYPFNVLYPPDDQENTTHKSA